MGEDRSCSIPNLILFGAGASHGSQECCRPPLGPDLFSALQEFDKSGWGSEIGELAKCFQNDFETGMGHLPGERFQTRQLKLAEYLFDFEPSNGNLYRRLARCIRRFERNKGGLWDGAFATLNYDRLLQLALEREYMPFSLLPQSNTYELCAPHGLCNLFSSTTPDRVPISIQHPSASIRDTNPDRPHTLVSTRPEFARASSIAPIMSFYEREKRSSTHPEWLKARQKRFAELAARATRIAIVGVSVQEHDKHVWEPLASTRATLLYCAPYVTEFQTWCRRYRSADNTVATGAFREKLRDTHFFGNLLRPTGHCPWRARPCASVSGSTLFRYAPSPEMLRTQILPLASPLLAARAGVDFINT